ncbi:MAG: hypothetical protein D3923_13430, partial [Candidatus Electrothrix sp. AR3]|nr:hypothetical protein [Candidatus Electrothrix sp. AR3]
MQCWLAIIMVILMTSRGKADEPDIHLTALTASIESTHSVKRIWFYLKLQNDGIPVDQNRISIKYWLTFEGNGMHLNYTDAPDAVVDFIPVTNRNGVNMVAEITFAESAESIDQGASMGTFEMKYVDDWWSTSQDESNDYSFLATAPNTPPVPNDKVTVYYDGVLVFGSEPALLLCSDGIQNGDETDIDCGGTCESTCIADQSCVIDSDCQNSNCADGICQDTVDINLAALTQSIGADNDLKIWLYLDIHNTGTNPVERNRISTKYWFTFEQ